MNMFLRQTTRRFPQPIFHRTFSNYFQCGVHVNPHPAKVHKGGEDAYSISSDKQVLSVADGVGGWAEQGVDPAKYSKTLCRLIHSIREQKRFVGQPIHLLSEAASQNNEIGSATCLVLEVDAEKPNVKSANLGDSGYIWLRKRGLDLMILHQSEPQQHSFNFPFQLGTSGDDPMDANTETHVVEDNDIFILGTDGLWDNLYAIKVVDLIRPFVRSQDELVDPELIAEIISLEAERLSS